ncbi:hypothetical protein IA931_14795, partial [Listeria welshimeri]|nr:hypothetical protein [Listeria welshimeri]
AQIQRAKAVRNLAANRVRQAKEIQNLRANPVRKATVALNPILSHLVNLIPPVKVT